MFVIISRPLALFCTLQGGRQVEFDSKDRMLSLLNCATEMRQSTLHISAHPCVL